MAENPHPVRYRIRVEGIVDSDWSDSLAGMAITIEQQESHHPVSLLTGILEDQGALQGVLNTLFLLNLPLLEVEQSIGDEPAEDIDS